jgi:hypothetical protein
MPGPVLRSLYFITLDKTGVVSTGLGYLVNTGVHLVAGYPAVPYCRWQRNKMVENEEKMSTFLPGK